MAASPLPNFLIIGAMKSATSTLHEQLARQPGIFMTTPKEPYFFSDDPVYAKGMAWYEALFTDADPSDIKGESTTHYTKLPTYPNTIGRIQAHVPNAKFIYVMRHPIDRLISQYVHHWSEKEVVVPIDDAIDSLPIMVDYSRYAYQLKPYLDAFGQDRILPVFFDRLHSHSQSELERICHFLGYAGEPRWDFGDETRNVSSERLQVNPLRDRIINLPLLSTIRKKMVPQGVRNRIKQRWQMTERPTISPERKVTLEAIFNEDLALLSQWFSVQLDCDNFKVVTRDQPIGWSGEVLVR